MYKFTSGDPLGEPWVPGFVQREVVGFHADLPRAFDSISGVGPHLRTVLHQVNWLQASSPAPGALASTYVGKKDPPSTDESKARPLKAGVMILAEGRGGFGTLGFFLHTGSSPDRVFAVTNWHVVANSRLTTDIIGKRAVSQPDTSCLGCTTNYVGTVATGSRSGTVDIALIELKPGIHYTADIRGLGGKDSAGNDIDAPIRGVHTLTAAEITAQAVQVKKRGFVTGLTGGKIVPNPTAADGSVSTEVDVLFGNQLGGVYQVAANPNPKSPGAATIFSTYGDSGSAVILDTDTSDPNFNFLVGLHAAGNPAPPTDDLDTPREAYSVFIPIKVILDYLHTEPGVAADLGLTSAQQLGLNVLTATAPNQVHIVASARTSVVEADMDAGPVQAERRLRALPQGRRYLELFERHREELVRLIRRQRRVSAAWQRTGVAELAQSLREAVRQPAMRIPERVAGRGPQRAIDEFVAVLKHHCSAALASDVDDVRGTLPKMAGLTLGEIFDRIEFRPAEAAE